jgi:Polysaccharide lyase family 4, domain II
MSRFTIPERGASRRRRRSAIGRLSSLFAAAMLLGSGLPFTSVAIVAAAPATCGDAPDLHTGEMTDQGSCNVTIDALDFTSGDPLEDFTYIINIDNSKLSDDPLALNTESNAPLVRTGDQDRPTVTLPDGRYLVSVRSLDHVMWGAHFTLPDDANDAGDLNLTIELTTQSEDHPLPLGHIRVFVFNDNAWTNGAPDTEEAGLRNFRVELKEQTGDHVTVDYFNNPLCGDGVCNTNGDGFVEIPDLGPATYYIDVHAPQGDCSNRPGIQHWEQTTTIDGGLSLWAPTEVGADGTGAPGEQLWEPPNVRTAYWFGFVCAPLAFPGNNTGTATITGTARNWVEWAPFTTGTFTDRVQKPFVALTNASTDQTVFIGRGNNDGEFTIPNVPLGDYNLAIWDEQLSYIMRFKPITVNAGDGVIDINETGDDGVQGVGVSRWFGWLDGHVYKDLNGNGQYDAGVDVAIPNTDVDQRWRDGSIKEGGVTDPNGYYEYPTAEGGQLGRWIIDEQGFSRFGAFPGASTTDERSGVVTPSCQAPSPAPGPCVPNETGGGLLMNELLLEGHRTTVDWGKTDYPEGEPGQIVGVTYWATTRNEFDPSKQAHEDYEPGIPEVTVLLETLGEDGLPNTDDDVVVNSYVTDHWAQPQDCNPIRDFAGNDITDQFAPKITPNCLEVPLSGNQTQEGAFDGGYAFADYCPGGYDLNSDPDDPSCVSGDFEALVPGDYIVHAIMPKDASDTRLCNSEGATLRVSEPHGSVPGGGAGCLYRIVREEDVNVDLGDQYAPQIPPPPCVGDDHVIDAASLNSRSYATGGDSTPLCDKHLIVLQVGQNANADFNMMTNQRTDPNGEDPTDTRTGDVQIPGRVIGQVFNDIYFERNPLSAWYGEPRPIAGIPVGIWTRADTVCAGGGTACNPANVSCIDGLDLDGDPVDPAHCYTPDRWRHVITVTTGEDGTYEALLPSTQTFNCPIPQGPCPGMYIAIVDDPGTKANPNPNYNPNLLTANTPFDIWPGLTTQLDTPVDPISGTACEDPAGVNPNEPPGGSAPARPELLQVSYPVVPLNGQGSREVTIYADFIGDGGPADATGGHVDLTDPTTGLVTTLTRQNGGIAEWTPGNSSTPDVIRISVPNTGAVFPATSNVIFRPGPKQLDIVTAEGVRSVNGITLHVLGADGRSPGNTVAQPDSVSEAAANTFDGTYVVDPSALASDVGASVSGSGIPAGTKIIAVDPGVGFTMSNGATTTGTQTLKIKRTETVKVKNHTRTAKRAETAVATDLGLTVKFSGKGWGKSKKRTITSVVPGRRFTFSAPSRKGGGSATRKAAVIRKSTGAFLNDGTFILDPTADEFLIGQPVSGPGIPVGAVIVASPVEIPDLGIGFIISLPATATAYAAPVDLVIGLAANWAAYQPNVIDVAAPTLGGHELQDAIDAAPAGSLLVLGEGTYNENILLWKKLTIQGLGPGGIVAAHEFLARDPEDPRFNIKGTVVDGRFYRENATAFNTAISNGPFVAPYDSVDPVDFPHGAAITVVAMNASAFNGDALTFGRIDGIGVTTGHGDAAGGIQLLARVNNLRITNDVLENNGGIVAGAIGVGHPYIHDSHNYGVQIANDRVIGNGGLADAGGIGIFYGSDNYEVARSVICANFSVVYGAGIAHIGLSPGGSIHDNQIFYNDSVDSGAGIAIETELPAGTCPDEEADRTIELCIGDGSGSVSIDRNLIQSNFSGDDGGGIFVLDALGEPVAIRNNMIVNNGAADVGGAITLDDSSNVRIINNTIANNVSTGSSENSAVGVPHAAGLASEANDPTFQASLPAGSKQFSDPRALFNNIFWNNQAYTLDFFGPGATLVSQGFIDFEVRGTANTADTFTPRFSDLTNSQILGPDGVLHPLPANQGNTSANPNFVAPFINELTVSGSRLDPQAAAVTITGADPPVGLTGDYHIVTPADLGEAMLSPVIDRGAGFSTLSVPPPTDNQNPGSPNSGAVLAPCSGTSNQNLPADFDRQLRPYSFDPELLVRGTPWDIGADEVAVGSPLVIPRTGNESPHFLWNTGINYLCSASTETR